MKVIITDSFLNRYKKVISIINLEKLLLKIKEINLITLKYPYLKLKLNIWWVAVRWVLLKTNWWNLVFLILCFKKDKNCWENIIFSKLEKEIYFMEEKVLNDIKNKNYIEY